MTITIVKTIPNYTIPNARNNKTKHIFFKIKWLIQSQLCEWFDLIYCLIVIYIINYVYVNVYVCFEN